MTATDEHWVLDQETDLPDSNDLRRYFNNAQHIPDEPLKKCSLPEGWNVRDLACMAVWYNEKSGAVLSVAGDLFSDPVVIGRNRRLPGIEANEQLARNILDFLCASKGSEKTAVGAEGLCHQIEVNLADFAMKRLKAALGDNWWTDGVPQNIRVECARRQEEEGNRFPKECYFDLIHQKSIMEKQWKYFEPAFRAVGLEGGKEKCLAWMDRLNEIRRMVAHPLKKHLARHTFSPEDRESLARWHAFVLKLKKLA